MACGIAFLEWLDDQGCLRPGHRLLDIGESCLYGAQPDQLRHFLDRYADPRPQPGPELDALIAEMSMRSNTIGDPTIRTLFVAELFAVTTLKYSSIDVVSAGFAERFDLNIHALAPALRNSFDMIVNFGTTEHLINQFNAYHVMHDACKPGGHLFHQVPGTGYLHHGYFTYDAQFFEDLGRANGYELKSLWYCGPQGTNAVTQVHAARHPSVRDAGLPYNGVSAFDAMPIPNSVINVLFKKVHDAPFRVGLELSTSATPEQVVADFGSTFIHPVTRATIGGPPLPPIRDSRRAGGFR